MIRKIRSLLNTLVIKSERIPVSEKSAKLTAEWAKESGFSKVTVGRGTYGTPEIVGVFSESLTIGSFVSIASEVTIILANHKSDGVSTYPFKNVDWVSKEFRPIQIPDVHAVSKGPVVIGNDVWIGKSAIILPGVSIGDGAVIGAQSVVTKDVLPYSVAVGNPARLVKFRLTPDQIAGLMQIRWWDWSEDFLRNTETDFLLPVDEFISKHQGNQIPKDSE